MSSNGQYEESTRGPGYWDVQEMMKVIKAHYTGDVFFETSCHLDRADGRVRWWVVAKVRIWKGRLDCDWVQAGWQFLGTGGTKTMPAAMYFALSSCLDKLQARQQEAERQARF